MAQYRESRRVAQAVRRHGIGIVHAHGQRIERGLVVGVDPLEVQLLGADIRVEADHLLLGSWVRSYDRRYGISEGDTLIVSQLGQDDDFFVLDVIGDEDFDLGDDPDELDDTVNYNTGSGHIRVTVPYYDQDGTKLGVLVLYDEATLRDFAGSAAGGTDSGGDTSPARAVTPT